MGAFHIRVTDPDTGEVREFFSEHQANDHWRERLARFDPPSKAPAIRPDAIEMWNPVDGKVATSKSAYYKQVREAGCYINDEAPRAEEAKLPDYKPKNIGQDVKRAYEEAEARGFKPKPRENHDRFE